MKQILKYFVGLFYLPFIVLAAIIALLRIIFTLTIDFAWTKGSEWHDKTLTIIDNFFKWLKP